MKLIVGLGNPGEKYEKTRHNAGFMLLNYLANEWDFPEFSMEKNFKARVSEKGTGNEKIILAKPETFMNLSGESVRAITDFYKISPENIIIAHDDLDLGIGKFKISKDSSSAGHNGAESVIRHLGTQNFKRIRMGVEKEKGRNSRNESGESFVLKDFTKEELDTLKSTLSEIKKELE